MGWKEIRKSYFSFSKKDRLGIYLILAMTALIYFIPKVFSSSPTRSFQPLDHQLAELVDTLDQRTAKKENIYSDEDDPRQYAYQPSVNKSYTEGVLFVFDPNTANYDDWIKMGLSEKTSKTIEKYKSKGGKFYKAEDFKKIWGLPAGFYERVAPYIRIENKLGNTKPTFASTPYKKQERTITSVDINLADTSAFIALPGIGSKLSLRIINFREKLGGFYSVNQVAETFGLPDSTFQKIKPYLKANTAAVKKININTATKDELKGHPYIRWNLANAIVAYREQHGAYKSLEELKNIVLIDEKTFEKIKAYLEY